MALLLVSKLTQPSTAGPPGPPPTTRPASLPHAGRMGETPGGLAVDGWIVAEDKTRRRTHPGALTVSFGNGTAWRCFL